MPTVSGGVRDAMRAHGVPDDGGPVYGIVITVAAHHYETPRLAWGGAVLSRLSPIRHRTLADAIEYVVKARGPGSAA